MNFFTYSAAFILALISIFSGCKCKDKEDKETQTASDYEQAQLISEDITNMADLAESGTTKFKITPGQIPVYDVMSGCATVTLDTVNSNDQDTITINFGPTNCLCADQRLRRGIIIIYRYGKPLIAGSYRTVNFNNYFINDRQVEGVHTITANGQNPAGNYNWTITAQNMKITNSANGKWHSWNSSRNREWLNNGTFIRTDDSMNITGSASGTNSNGKNYTATIISPLVKEAGCKWIVKGSVQITPDNKPLRTLDFGTGTCDYKATVNINGNNYNIELH